VWLRIDMEAAVMDCSYVWRRRRKYDIDITRDAILSMHHADCRSTETSSPR
jgi:hypothetical protein